MRRTAFLALIMALLTLLSTPAVAEKRVALVVGNSAYRHATPLANPKNDAGDMAARLEELGFEVVMGVNLDMDGLRDTVREFVKRLEGADIALFFYAGRGLQVNGENYIAPIWSAP